MNTGDYQGRFERQRMRPLPYPSIYQQSEKGALPQNLKQFMGGVC